MYCVCADQPHTKGMTLRDEQGEIEVGIGDLFEVKAATFSVICPEVTIGNSPVWVRLHAGIIDHPSGPIKIEEGKPAPYYLFPGALVAQCVRATRLKSADKPQQSLNGVTDASPAPQVVADAPRARPSKKRAAQNQPASATLFD